jgi:hypothetical protein
VTEAKALPNAVDATAVVRPFFRKFLLFMGFKIGRFENWKIERLLCL